jgi:hypothetical protein
MFPLCCLLRPLMQCAPCHDTSPVHSPLCNIATVDCNHVVSHSALLHSVGAGSGCVPEPIRVDESALSLPHPARAGGACVCFML